MDEKRGRVGDLQAVAERHAGDPTTTSSARASIDGDGAVPRSLAVFRIDRLEFGRLHDRQLRRLSSSIMPLSIQGDGGDKSRTNRFTKTSRVQVQAPQRGHLVAHAIAISWGVGS